MKLPLIGKPSQHVLWSVLADIVEHEPISTSHIFAFRLWQKYDRDERKAVITTKVRSSIPIILRDMAPPEGSIFDPAKKWDEEKQRRERLASSATATATSEIEDKTTAKKAPKKNVKKQSTADAIKESNAVEKSKKDLERDLMKLSNLRTLKTLQDATCDTPLGKIHRMIKMLHLAVSDLKLGSVGSSEAEVLDILWALEEMSTFKHAEAEISAEKKSKKDSKEDEKKSKKDSKKVCLLLLCMRVDNAMQSDQSHVP